MYRHSHFQDLQQLNIYLESGSLQLMVQLAQAGSFQSIRDLTLDIHPPVTDNVNLDLCSLFAALNPLVRHVSVAWRFGELFRNATEGR